MADLRAQIEELWRRADTLGPDDAVALGVVTEAIGLLDRGEARVAEVDPATDGVVVHQWLKQAILLLFRLRAMETTEVGPFEYADKLPLKQGYAAAGVRVVPGASARWGSYLGPGVICMPSYVNIGARVGAGTMVDTWATVGSCAQIGERVHLSGGVGIGGVLEPPQAAPVVVEDDAMIGSRCMITQGARVGRGSVIGEGTILNPSIPVVDAQTGEELGRGHVPAWSVAVQAALAARAPGRGVLPPVRARAQAAGRRRAPRQGAAQRCPADPRGLRVNDGEDGGLFGLATALVSIPSVSHHETAIADAVEAAFSLCPWLSVERVGDNVVARTDLGRATRLVLAGHLDTVPPVDGNDVPHTDGSTLHGVGAADMKGGLAVFLHLAGSVPEPVVDVTWCCYVAEEVDQRFNGLRHLFEHRPDLLEGDAAILGEPTAGVVEAGCQGTLRLAVDGSGTPRPHCSSLDGDERDPPARAPARHGGGL